MPIKVFISAGHGGTDSGAIGNGFKEKDLNLDIALACNNELVRHGITTMMSRMKDEDDSVTQEVTECNRFSPDVAVSFHNNAGGGDGCEAFCSIERGLGEQIANAMLNRVYSLGQNIRSGEVGKIKCKTKLGDDGKDYYYFIRNTNCHAVIIELAFIDNANDIKFIDTLQKRQLVGVECAKAILEVLGVSFEDENAVPMKTNEEIANEVLKGLWGSGAERRMRLEADGYDYDYIQEIVNTKLGYTKEKPKKSNNEIADEVIKGLWGNGQERKDRLTQAGYNYNSIQRIVNERCK